jgi:hypothetical protein
MLLTIGPSPPCPSRPHTRRPAPRFVSHRLVEPISQHTHDPLHSPPSGPHTPGPSPSSRSMQRLPSRSPKSTQQPSSRTLGSAGFPFTHIKLGKGLGRARRVPNHRETSHHWRVLPEKRLVAADVFLSSCALAAAGWGRLPPGKPRTESCEEDPWCSRTVGGPRGVWSVTVSGFGAPPP